MDPYPTLFPGVLPWWFHAARFPHGGEDAPKGGDGPTEADGSDLAKAEELWRWRWQFLTLPETNIAPENRPSQKETNLPTIHFQVLC